MNGFSLANSLLVSVRIYRALLVAYPKKFREHYETQMVQVFRDSFCDAYCHHAVYGVIDLWLHTFFDLVPLRSWSAFQKGAGICSLQRSLCGVVWPVHLAV